MVVIVVIGGLSFNPVPKSNDKQNNSTNTVNSGLNVPFTLKINQTAAIDIQNLKITFLNITKDSRPKHWGIFNNPKKR